MQPFISSLIFLFSPFSSFLKMNGSFGALIKSSHKRDHIIYVLFMNVVFLLIWQIWRERDREKEQLTARWQIAKLMYIMRNK